VTRTLAQQTVAVGRLNACSIFAPQDSKCFREILRFGSFFRRRLALKLIELIVRFSPRHSFDRFRCLSRDHPAAENSDEVSTNYDDRRSTANARDADGAPDARPMARSRRISRTSPLPRPGERLGHREPSDRLDIMGGSPMRPEIWQNRDEHG